jgi:hypothetical protein
MPSVPRRPLSPGEILELKLTQQAYEQSKRGIKKQPGNYSPYRPALIPKGWVKYL